MCAFQRPFLIEYVGNLKLTEGAVDGLSNMERNGEVQVTMGEKAVLQLPIRFPVINVRRNLVDFILIIGNDLDIKENIAVYRYVIHNL